MNNPIVFNNLLRNSFSSKKLLLTAVGNFLLTAGKSSSPSAAAGFVGDGRLCPPSHSERCLVGEENFAVTDEVMKAVFTPRRHIIVQQDVHRRSIFVEGLGQYHQASIGVIANLWLFGGVRVQGRGAGRRFSSHITQRLLSSGTNETPSEAPSKIPPIPQMKGIPKARVEGGVGDTLSLEGLNTALIIPGEFGRLVIPPTEVDINETISVSVDASVDKHCSIAIVGRLNKNGAVLFWKVVRRPLLKGYGTNKSDYYETGAVEEGVKAVHEFGYDKHGRIIITNDCNRAVIQINGKQKCSDVNTLNTISRVYAQIRRFDRPKKVQVIGKLPRLKFGVDALSKFGQDPTTMTHWDSFRQRMSNEAIRFPIQDSEIVPFL